MVCYCCVKGCKNNKKSVKKDSRVISFHAFPSNPELRQKWLRAIGRPDWDPPSHVRICSAHFSPDKVNQDGYRTRIKDDAYPVMALPPNSNFEASNIKVCRICLATDVKMFNLETEVLKNYIDLFARFADNQLNIEGLPRFVCYECAVHLTKFSNLMEKSMAAQTTLLDIFAKNAEITENLVKKRDRKQLNLQSKLRSYYTMPCHVFEFLYNEEEKISCLKNRYFTDDTTIQSKLLKNDTVENQNEIIFKTIKSDQDMERHIKFKCEVLDSVTKMDSEDDINNGENGMEYSSDIENTECENLNSSLILTMKDLKTKNFSSVDKGENKLVEIQEMKVKKKSRKRIGLTPDEVNMEKYFNIVNLSLQEQIAEWSKMATKLYFPSKTTFKCEICTKLFSSKKFYECHITCHDTKRGNSECPVCKQRFKNDVLVKSHANRTHGKKFQCKSCSKVFNNVSVAKKHHRWHSGHIYTCTNCPFRTVHASALAQHARTQHAFGHTCTLCGHSFISERGLRLHAATAHKECDKNESTNAKFRCEACLINFASEGARRVHILTSKQHKKNAQKIIVPPDPLLKTTCKHCGNSFSSRKELVDHLRIEHRSAVKKKTSWRLPDDSYPTQCEHCNETVNNRKEHWWHVRKEHPSLRQHYRPVITAVCETCGKGFQNLAKLRLHELRHRSPTYRCDKCARVLHDKHALKRHAATHAPPPHACRTCGRAFALKGNLARHERVHTGVTPYECNLCGKRFKYSSSVKLHVRTVHFMLPHPPRAPRVPRPARNDASNDSN